MYVYIYVYVYVYIYAYIMHIYIDLATLVMTPRWSEKPSFPNTMSATSQHRMGTHPDDTYEDDFGNSHLQILRIHVPFGNLTLKMAIESEVSHSRL